MDADFWHSRWQAGQIGFHEGRPNALLTAHLGALGLATGARIFLPLCGKACDIGWLMEQGFRVAGAELSEIAIRELFDDLGLTPEITPTGALTRYSAEGIDIYVGDIFALESGTLGPVDAVYDRAALVALPPDIRPRYARHLADLTGGASQLLITFDYRQEEMPGPPFSVPEAEISRHYDTRFARRPLESRPVTGRLKGLVEAVETITLLVSRP